jgi:hypothetical protein
MTPTPDGLETANACWSALKAYLEQRSRELNAEVRGYPTPIARCDDQLPKLLEQRSRANEQLRLAVAVDAESHAGSARWVEACRQILASPPIIAEDETETAIRARLQTALAGLMPRQP